jgi:drug/metabolite transporter (DMT)-like permease
MPAPAAIPVACLLLNAFIWGVSWWPFRQLNGLGLHSLWATGFAFAFAAAVISLGRRDAWKALLTRPALVWLILATGVTNAAFNWGVMIGEVVRVVLLFYLMPVWAALLARWLLAEPITAAAVLRIALALTGAWIVLDEPGADLPGPSHLADWLGLVGGVGFAGVSVLVRRHAAVPDEARALAMFLGGACVALALAALLTLGGRIEAPPAPAPLWLAGLAVLALLLLAGNLALQYGAARLPSSVTALVMLSEVVFAALSSALLAGEALSARTLSGGLLIMLAAVLAALPGRLDRLGTPAG